MDNQNIYAVRCDVCSGIGHTNNYHCEKCGGTGRIPVLDGEQWATDRARVDLKIASWINGLLFAVVFGIVLWTAIVAILHWVPRVIQALR
jgi:hypothetical protein